MSFPEKVKIKRWVSFLNLTNKMEEKDLKRWYNRSVRNRNFYRVVSNEYLPKIRKKGLTPEENPYDHFKKELGSIRAGRANPAMIEEVMVESYGAKTPLKQLGSISVTEARCMTVQPWDKNLIKAFENDQDIHSYTASLIFDVKEKDVTLQMRNSAKRVNFGIIYGMSAFGLAKDLQISQTEAQDFIDRYFLRYPAVKKFMDEQIKQAEWN